MKAGTVPRFAVGAGYAVYRGPTTGGAVHRHAAFQIAIAMHGEVVMLDSSSVEHRSAVLVVAPMQRHRMFGLDDLLTFFVEPGSRFADGLRRSCADGIVAAPQLRGLREQDVAAAPSEELDPRLLRALDVLRGRDIPIPELAAAVGLSPQRLRVLARQQVGMPLPRWRVWARLQRAAEALRTGSTVATAAAEAGFADQARLTRRMREMIGLTPAAVLPALRPQP